MSARDFCTSIVDVTNASKALFKPNKTVALAPNAITRALAASKDLLNSETCPVILPNGWPPLVLKFKLRLYC